MSGFHWTYKSSAAAVGLAEGKTRQEVAAEVGVTERTLYRWIADTEFWAEVNRLSLMVGIAGRAERLRIAMRVLRQKIKDDGKVDTDKDALDWLRFAQSETDGVKLDLTALFEAQASVAGQGS